MSSINGIQNISIDDAWKQVKAKQGFLGKTWNAFKEVTNIGISESKCESMLDAYKRGEIPIEEAMEYIEKYNNKQENMTNLFANIATGAVAITAAALTGGASVAASTAIAIGAPVGAVTKVGLKIFDRTTNNIQGDDFDTKEIIKDAISGATPGATSAVSSGIMKGIKTRNIATSIKNGAKCGVICGGASGAINYLTDSALDENVKFNFGDLTRNTITSAVVSGGVGTVAGAGLYGVHYATGNLGEAATGSLCEDITASSLRKIGSKIVTATA